ncbi:MAG: nucleotidyltransferase [Flavipsychrobacter sp.]|nr:nucleotidyltransferase [Flavipsychrobacter sp.]
MENKDKRWAQRFDNYKEALQTIAEVIPVYDNLSELEKDGLIQRFEFTFDLAWKVMQDYLQFSGYNDIKGPRSCIKQMAHDNLIDAFVWGEILIARNELSHIYNEDKSRDFLDKIVNDFYPVFQAFNQQMQNLL